MRSMVLGMTAGLMPTLQAAMPVGVQIFHSFSVVQHCGLRVRLMLAAKMVQPSTCHNGFCCHADHELFTIMMQAATASPGAWMAASPWR